MLYFCRSCAWKGPDSEANNLDCPQCGGPLVQTETTCPNCEEGRVDVVIGHHPDGSERTRSEVCEVCGGNYDEYDPEA